MNKVKIGIIGCGNISSIYFQAGKTFEILEVVACADLDGDRARRQAEAYGVPKVCTVEQLLIDTDIDIVVNLTIPKAHAEIACAALEAGKHVYGEKPLAISREDGQRIVALAEEKSLRIGNAPDTFLGGGLQTARKLVDDGWIGDPVAATVFMMGHGHENWHPDPIFYYQVGGGPMFDMGPYYITALISLIGNVKRVTGSVRTTFPERLITSQPKYGEIIQVETPTHIAGILDFDNGAVGTMITSFDVWHHQLPFIEIYGTEGSMRVPDPNTFGGPVLVRRHDAKQWSEMPLTHGFTENSRGIGLADMAYAIQTERQHRANGQLAYHVLDIMHGFQDSSEQGQHVLLESECDRPKSLPMGIDIHTMDRLFKGE